uniref:Uncharacterized protein n=1 Tax=Aegilops tauschii subsp. strangulata TaxID=200361 RepID=A0A453GVG3_AEGTS
MPLVSCDLPANILLHYMAILWSFALQRNQHKHILCFSGFRPSHHSFIRLATLAGVRAGSVPGGAMGLGQVEGEQGPRRLRGWPVAAAGCFILGLAPATARTDRAPLTV